MHLISSALSTIAAIYTIATFISRPTWSKKQLRKQRSNQFLLQMVFTERCIYKLKGLKKKKKKKTHHLFLVEMLKYKRKLSSLVSIERVE